MCIYLYLCTSIYIHVCTYISVHKSTYIHICIYLHIYIFIYMYISVHCHDHHQVCIPVWCDDMISCLVLAQSGKFPLHLAVRQHVGFEVVKTLLDAFPDALRTPDRVRCKTMG